MVGKKYETFEAVSVSKQVVAGTNYKVIYNVTTVGEAKDGNKSVLIVKFFKPLPSKELTDPKLELKSVRLPNGILHQAGGKILGGQTNWKTNMDSGLKKMFKNF